MTQNSFQRKETRKHSNQNRLLQISDNEEKDVGVATGDQELKVLPDNEDEEKEEILLTDTKKPKTSKEQPSKTSQQKNEKKEQTMLAKNKILKSTRYYKCFSILPNK